MVDYILVNSTRKSMLKSIFPLSIVTFLSRITGFLREYLLYSTFGAGPLLDIFVIAFRIPQLTRRFFAEGSLSQALLPELAALQQIKGQQEYRAVYHQGFLFLIVCMGGFTLSVIFAPMFWLSLLAPGLINHPLLENQIIGVVQLMVPYGFFVALVSFYALLMQLHHRYLLNGFSPIILNMAIILTILFKKLTIIDLAWAVFYGGIIQFFVQYLGGRQYLKFSWHDLKLTPQSKPLLINFFKLSIMAFLILINTSIDQRFLTYSHIGSLSEYYLCERIIELPLGVIVYSLSVVFASYYAKFHSLSIKRVQLENKVILFICYFVVPCALGSFLFAPYLIRIFLHNPESIERTAQLLKVFSLCILPMTLNKIFVVICTIKKNQNLIIGVHVVGSIVNFFGDYLLSSWSTLGIATSTMITLCVQLFIFNSYCNLTKRFLKLPFRLIWVSICALLLILVGERVFKYLDFAFEMNQLTYFFVLSGIVAVSSMSYIACIYSHVQYLHKRIIY